MTKKIKDIYYLDNKRVNEKNLDEYLKILSNHWVIPNISKGFETKNNILWSVQYHGGWLKNMSNITLLDNILSITNRFAFDKQEKMWYGYLDKPDLTLLSPINKYFNLMSIGIYDEITLEEETELEYGTKYYVWKSNNPEDILNIVFNGLTYRYNQNFKDFSHTNVITNNINVNIEISKKNNIQIKINNLEINIYKLEIDSIQLINKERELETEYLKFKIDYLELKNTILSV